MEVIFAFDLACKKEAAHRARGADDAQHAEEGGRVLIGGHFFLVPKGQDNGRVEIQVNLKFFKIERKISKINLKKIQKNKKLKVPPFTMIQFFTQKKT